ncbi:hypothetical protein BpHYR1_041012, partial [Brachionus plicatilis]
MAPRKQFKKECVEIQINKEQANLEKASRGIEKYFGTLHYVPLTEIDEWEKFNELEIGQTVTYNISVGRKKYQLLAELKSKELFKIVPGRIFGEIDVTNGNDSIDENDLELEEDLFPQHNNEQACNKSNTDVLEFFANGTETNDVSSKLDRIIENQQATIDAINNLNKTLQNFMPKLKETENHPIVKRLERRTKPSAKILNESNLTTSCEKFEDETEVNESEIKSEVIESEVKSTMSEEIVSKKYFKDHLLTLIEQEIPKKDKNLGLDMLKKMYSDSIIKIKENFENECQSKSVKDSKSIFTFRNELISLDLHRT